MDILSIFNNIFAGEPKQEVATTVTPPTPAVKKADYYEKLSFIESSGGKNVKSKTSSALGPFQFTKETWADYTKEMGVNYSLNDRLDYKKSKEVVEHFTNKNKELLKGVLSREPNDTETYMAHKLGRSGVTKFFNASPMATIDTIVSAKALTANKNVFYNDKGKPRTVAEVYDIFDTKFTK